MSSVVLQNVSKSFGPVPALDSVQLKIGSGEIFFLLGPSGCGKTTILRLIAGLEQPSTGRIFLDGQDVTDLPPQRRQIGMVSQGYTLWPHLTVGENVAFGLAAHGLGRETVRRQTEEALTAVQLPGFAHRRIQALSGGEQQRVSLARALAPRPRCLLLDEPLSNLDAPLRAALRLQIRVICQESRLTAICVTHDPHDALVAADRVGFLHHGRLTRVGAPGELLAP